MSAARPFALFSGQIVHSRVGLVCAPHPIHRRLRLRSLSLQLLPDAAECSTNCVACSEAREPEWNQNNKILIKWSCWRNKFNPMKVITRSNHLHITSVYRRVRSRCLCAIAAVVVECAIAQLHYAFSSVEASLPAVAACCVRFHRGFCIAVGITWAFRIDKVRMQSVWSHDLQPHSLLHCRIHFVEWLFLRCVGFSRRIEEIVMFSANRLCSACCLRRWRTLWRNWSPFNGPVNNLQNLDKLNAIETASTTTDFTWKWSSPTTATFYTKIPLSRECRPGYCRSNAGVIVNCQHFDWNTTL